MNNDGANSQFLTVRADLRGNRWDDYEAQLDYWAEAWPQNKQIAELIDDERSKPHE